MGADASIFQTQPVRSVSDYMGEMDLRDLRRAQLTGATQNNALHALTMDQTRQTMADTQRRQNALRAAVQAVGPNADPTRFASALLQNPDTMDAGVALQKHLADLAETQAKTKRSAGLTPDLVATTAKTVGETTKSAWELQQDQRRSALQHVASFDSADQAVQSINTDAKLSMAERKMLLDSMPTDPAQFRTWQMRLVSQLATPQQQAELGMPKMVSAGGALVNTNPMFGQMGQGAPSAIPITQSADNKATVGAAMANAGALRDQAQATRDSATIQTGFANETSLRKEFEGLPEIKNYKQAYPAFAAIKDAVQRNTTQSDINIVYGLAKLYDPTSVVREGEYATVANSPNIPERIKGYAQYLAGGGKLSPETKKQIMAEAEGRIGTYKTEADKARFSYEGIAKQRGMKPEAVFQAMGDSPLGAGGATNANDLHRNAEAIMRGKK